MLIATEIFYAPEFRGGAATDHAPVKSAFPSAVERPGAAGLAGAALRPTRSWWRTVAGAALLFPRHFAAARRHIPELFSFHRRKRRARPCVAVGCAAQAPPREIFCGDGSSGGASPIMGGIIEAKLAADVFEFADCCCHL
mmetsp:Transcript_17445/g.28592  ORF Transcript_17445/g.28592 Transcript_17445/m.28592 type:complete len:140 (-) Transcript_17445:665-1084(-)